MAFGTFFLVANKRWIFRFALPPFPLFAFAVNGLGLRHERIVHTSVQERLGLRFFPNCYENCR